MRIFKNKYGEVRSGWKIVLTLIVMFALMNVVAIFIGIILGILMVAKESVMELYAIENSSLFFSVSIILQNLALIGSSMIIWKVFEKKKVTFMGLINIKEGYKELGIGLLLGAVTITIVGIVLLLIGEVKLVNSLSKPNISYELLSGLIAFIAVGFGEEIFGRAYCMSVLKQTRNKYVILGVSSAIFAAMHLGNNGVSILALINLFLVGILFGYMFIKSGNVWMPIGFHITWNYFQGYILGFQVSGNEVKGIYQLQNAGNSFINGGAFGPEGGIVVTAILIITLFIVGAYYKDRNIDNFFNNKIYDMSSDQ